MLHSVEVYWPKVCHIPGFENPEHLQQIFEEILFSRCIAFSSGLEFKIEEGGWERIYDVHCVYRFDNLRERDLEALRTFLVLMRSLLRENSLFLRINGQGHFIDAQEASASSYQWVRQAVEAKSDEHITHYQSHCLHILDDIVLLALSICPPCDKWSEHSSCPIQADKPSVERLRRLLRDQPIGRADLHPVVAGQILKDLPLRPAALQYSEQDSSVIVKDLTGTSSIVIPSGSDRDRPHWGLWIQGPNNNPVDIQRLSEDQDWRMMIRFFPITYRYNRGLEQLMHKGIAGMPSLADVYLGRKKAYCADTSLFLDPARSPSAEAFRLLFTAHLINRAVAQVTLVTRDSKIVLGKRLRALDYYRGAWDATIGEGLQPLRAKEGWPLGDMCLVKGFERALEEELGLLRLEKHVREIVVTGIGREWHNGNTAVFGTVWLSLSCDELVRGFKDKMTEFEAIAFVDVSHILDLCKSPLWSPEQTDQAKMYRLSETCTDLQDRWTGHARLKMLLTLLAHAARERGMI